MDNLFANIVSNIWYALIALVVLTLVLHVILVFPKNLSKKQWKKVDYIWISLTAIGLIGAVNNVGIIQKKNEIDAVSHRIPFQFKYLSHFLPPGGSPTVCREHTRTEYSPADFDSIVADYYRTCEWSRKMHLFISSVDTSQYELIDVSQIPVLETTENIWYKEEVLGIINEYNLLVKEWKKNDLEYLQNTTETLTFYMPFFLILGLAIRLTKVTGEIRHEK